jgi:N-acyl-phosphatidylethanolamine-hydrolysing phospholipase D
MSYAIPRRQIITPFKKYLTAAAARRPLHHHTFKRFRNPWPGFERRTIGEVLRWVFIDRRKGQKVKHRGFFDLEQAGNDGSFLRSNATEFTVTWAGHSTVLIQLGGLNILTDPIWSKHPSPLSFLGPRRYMNHGIAFDDLPPIHVVLISHDHYDHFDRSTIRRFGKSTLFIVPLGFGRRLRRMGIGNCVELDWWQEYIHHGVRFVCTPAQHYSSRRIADKNRTLWCSWVFQHQDGSVFFAGDTGYFPGFREIGEKYGPFDLVCLPIGAYLPRRMMGHIHMNPPEAIAAYHDLGGQIFLAIHWGTFNLGDDAPDLAPRELCREIERLGLDHELFWPLKHGETRLIRPVDE